MINNSNNTPTSPLDNGTIDKKPAESPSKPPAKKKDSMFYGQMLQAGD